MKAKEKAVPWNMKNIVHVKFSFKQINNIEYLI